MRMALDKGLSTLLQILVVIMLVSALLQVLARLLSVNIQFTEELTVYAMMWVALLGAAYGFGAKKHIAIDLLQASLSESSKHKLQILIELIVAVFALLVMIIGGIRLVYITLKLEQVSAVMQVPKGLVYIVLPLSGLIIMLYNYLNISETLNSKTK